MPAEQREGVFNQKSLGQRPEVVRKAARNVFFDLDGARSASLAPIKVKKSNDTSRSSFLEILIPLAI